MQTVAFTQRTLGRNLLLGRRLAAIRPTSKGVIMQHRHRAVQAVVLARRALGRERSTRGRQHRLAGAGLDEGYRRAGPRHEEQRAEHAIRARGEHRRA